jgi:hypothetical protein
MFNSVGPIITREIAFKSKGSTFFIHNPYLSTTYINRSFFSLYVFTKFKNRQPRKHDLIENQSGAQQVFGATIPLIYTTVWMLQILFTCFKLLC